MKNSITTDNILNEGFVNMIKYLPNNRVYINLPCILTLNKTIAIGMPYLKVEGSHTDSIRVLDIRDAEGYVYIKIQNLKTGEVHTISWILQNDIEYCLWYLVSLDYIERRTIKSKINRMIDDELLEIYN